MYIHEMPFPSRSPLSLSFPTLFPLLLFYHCFFSLPYFPLPPLLSHSLSRSPSLFLPPLFPPPLSLTVQRVTLS